MDVDLQQALFSSSSSAASSSSSSSFASPPALALPSSIAGVSFAAAAAAAGAGGADQLVVEVSFAAFSGTLRLDATGAAARASSRSHPPAGASRLGPPALPLTRPSPLPLSLSLSQPRARSPPRSAPPPQL